MIGLPRFCFLPLINEPQVLDQAPRGRGEMGTLVQMVHWERADRKNLKVGKGSRKEERSRAGSS